MLLAVSSAWRVGDTCYRVIVVDDDDDDVPRDTYLELPNVSEGACTCFPS